ncbi:hypothetical protein HDZ31DRAFT_15293, partial [Schizophyllum fasciatum]
MTTITSTASASTISTTIRSASATVTITTSSGSATTTITTSPAVSLVPARSQSPSPSSLARSRWYQRLYPRRWLTRRSLSPLGAQHAMLNDQPSSPPITSPAPAPHAVPSSQEMSTAAPLALIGPSGPPPLPSISAPDPAAGTLSMPAYPPVKGSKSALESSENQIPVLWSQAVARYTATSGVDLSTPENTSLNSKAAILAYIQERGTGFQVFRDSGPKGLRDFLFPIVRVVDVLGGPMSTVASKVYPFSGDVFSALGFLVRATIAVHEELAAACEAFETIGRHLRIIEPVADANIHDLLREASIEVLAQVINILGVITKLQRDGRIRTWMIFLYKPNARVASALDDLGKLASMHHHSISAVTLAETNKMLNKMTDFVARDEQDQAYTHKYLEHITQVAHRDQIAANRGVLDSIQSALLEQIEGSKDETKSDDIARVTQWLQYPNSSVKVNTLIEDRNRSTGSWFLDGPEFAAFKAESNKLLLLHGKAGCGKSTIIAAATRDLEARCATADLNAVVLTHLFDLTNELQDRSLRALLSSLLCQLAFKRDDALLALKRFRKLTPSQIFMDDDTVNGDIEILLDSYFAEGSALGSLAQAPQIREEVIAKADGNFRWTVLLLQELVKVADVPTQVLPRLKALPQTLQRLYEHRLKAISPEDRDNVRRLLMWAVLSRAHLSPKEFARLLSFDYSSERPVYDALLEPRSPNAVVALVGSTFMSV